MKKSNRARIIAIVLLGLILILEIAWIIRQGKNEDTQLQADAEALQTQSGQISTQEITEPVVTVESTTFETPAATESTEIEPTETEPVVSEPVETEPPETEPKATKPKGSSQNKKPAQKQTEPTEPDNTCLFPYTIADSTLVIEQINSYDGIFFEDGSDKEVTNVTAMVLTNTGDVCVEYVTVTIERDGTKLNFAASAIEAGGTVVVMEAGCTQFAAGEYRNCTAEIAVIQEMLMTRDQISVEENPEGGLLVTNLTDADIPCVRIFYKFYMQDTDVYVGGITYTAKVLNLASESSCIVTPSHYFPGYSKIVMVKTYDSDE